MNLDNTVVPVLLNYGGTYWVPEYGVQVTQEEPLVFVKEEKCSFTKETITFLGHIMGARKAKIDMEKVRAIQEWKTPTQVTEWTTTKGFSRLVWHG